MDDSAPVFIRKFLEALSPLELVALWAAAFSLLLILVFPVGYYIPDGHSTAFALEHYVVGLVLALLVAMLFSDGPKNAWGVLILARNVFAFTVVVFLHFNFKLWAQLVNPVLFDDWYRWTDQLLNPLLDAVFFLNLGFGPLKEWLPNAYHDVFVFMFFSSFAVHAVVREGRRCLSELVTAVALILGLGGVAYMVAPAWGPFIYSPDEDNISFHIQQGMSTFQQRFLVSGGAAYTGAEFISPLAAMPSLHIAHAWALWAYARQYVPWLGYAYLPLVMFIFTEAVSSRWHYLIDLLAGLCITYACIFLSRKMHAYRGAQ